MGDTFDLVRGQWREILPQLGISQKFLTGRNGPCPICGGTDRFRFHDRHKDGDYYCNQCGAGKGIKLVAQVNGWEYIRACREICAVLGIKRGRRSTQTAYTPRIEPHAFNRDGWEPKEKSLRDATLWLRRYHPDRLGDWLARNEPELRQWINRTRPWGYYPEERKLESVQAMMAAGTGVDWGAGQTEE